MGAAKFVSSQAWERHVSNEFDSSLPLSQSALAAMEIVPSEQAGQPYQLHAYTKSCTSYPEL